MNKSFFYTRMAWSNIRKNGRIYVPYILSSIGTILMYYIISSLAKGIAEDSWFGSGTMSQILGLGTGVITVFAVLFLFYTNSFIIKRRKKEMGLYNILGMEKRHIRRVVFLETFLVALASIILGLLSGILLSKLMFLLLGKLMQAETPLTFVIPPQAIADTLFMFSLIFLLTLLYNLIQIQRSNPIALLHGSSVGEKEPRANWLIAFVGAMCLGGGYYLSVTIKSPMQAFIMFFVAVILVILGTYCLFTAGMTVILKILKRNKKYYYKSGHFTTVSGMLYRMKQNAAGLATICILSTCVLVMVATTFSLYTSVEDAIKERYPRDISISMDNVNEEVATELDQRVAAICREMGVTPENVLRQRYVSITAAKQGNSFLASDGDMLSNQDFGLLVFTTAEEYNKSTGKAISIAPGEAYTASNRDDGLAGTVSLGDTQLRVMPLEESLFSGLTNANVANAYAFVLPDTQTLLHIVQQLTPDSYSPATQLSYGYSFDMSQGEDTILQTEEKLSAMLSDTGKTFFAESQGYSYSSESIAGARSDFYSLYSGLFFLGIFLGLMFIMALALIIYYKQVTEGYEDKHRFEIMQNVGMSHKEVKRSIHSQILLVFFIPLVMSVIHLAFAMPILLKLLALLNLVNTAYILISAAAVVILFAILYTAVYLATAKTYYKIVET